MCLMKIKTACCVCFVLCVFCMNEYMRLKFYYKMTNLNKYFQSTNQSQCHCSMNCQLFPIPLSF